MIANGGNQGLQVMRQSFVVIVEIRDQFATSQVAAYLPRNRAETVFVPACRVVPVAPEFHESLIGLCGNQVAKALVRAIGHNDMLPVMKRLLPHRANGSPE